MALKFPNITPFSELESVGVAIYNVGGDQNHIAVLFKPDEDLDETLLLHVPGYKDELIELPSVKYAWLELSGIHPLRLPYVLATIQQIADVNKDTQLRYGFDHGLYCIDPKTGLFNSNYDYTIGFTCATFVIEVFLATGIKLIDWDSWPNGNLIDQRFKGQVYDYLYKLYKKDIPGANLEYLIAQSGHETGSRFKPEEVAASTQLTNWPIKKSDLEQPAVAINIELKAYKASI